MSNEPDYSINGEHYYHGQMVQVCPLPLSPKNLNGVLRLQIRSIHGATNWLTITPQQFQAIERILTAPKS